jgi:hypothetical protein
LFNRPLHFKSVTENQVWLFSHYFLSVNTNFRKWSLVRPSLQLSYSDLWTKGLVAMRQFTAGWRLRVWLRKRRVFNCWNGEAEIQATSFVIWSDCSSPNCSIFPRVPPYVHLKQEILRYLLTLEMPGINILVSSYSSINRTSGNMNTFDFWHVWPFPQMRECYYSLISVGP